MEHFSCFTVSTIVNTLPQQGTAPRNSFLQRVLLLAAELRGSVRGQIQRGRVTLRWFHSTGFIIFTNYQPAHCQTLSLSVCLVPFCIKRVGCAEMISASQYPGSLVYSTFMQIYYIGSLELLVRFLIQKQRLCSKKKKKKLILSNLYNVSYYKITVNLSQVSVFVTCADFHFSTTLC